MDNNKYILSIVIPVYNAQKYIPGLVEQLLKSYSEDMEIIFVDDGSTDDSLHILNQLPQGIYNLKIISQKNIGAPGARNRGIKESEGKYIWFFDVDDKFGNNAIKDVIEILRTSDYDLYIGNMKFVNEKGVGRVQVPVFKDNKSKDIKKLFFWDSYPGNKIYKRKIILKHKIFWDDVKIQQDLNFYLKYIVFCKEIYYHSGILYSYVKHENSISTTCSRKITDVVKSVKLVEQFYQKNYCDKKYKKELEYNLIKHIFYQVEKISKLKTFSDKIYVYFLFRRTIKSVNWRNNKYISNAYSKKIKEYFCFRF